MDISDILEKSENYDEVVEKLKNVLIEVLESGELTQEQNNEIKELKLKNIELYKDLKGNYDNVSYTSINEKLNEIKKNMVGATTDDILNILTDNGRKTWLYRDSDNNVLIDTQAIPELTVLVNKLNLIATSDEDSGKITLNPDFIEMVVEGVGSGENTVKDMKIMFYLSTSREELIGGEWLDKLPSKEEQQGKFVWTKNVTIYTDDTTKETEPICVTGQNGTNGADGVDGEDGVSMVYKGEFASHPSNPQNGWYYRNTVEKKTFVYQSGAWYQMTVDGNDGKNGNDGKDGLSIEYKGVLANPPSNPKKNWSYKDSDNGIVYIYTGLSWEVLTYDGSNGTDGTNGSDGLSVFCTYNDSVTQPVAPTGNGTTGGWHTNWTSNVIWVSQKVSSSASDGTWGTPIKIQGFDGENGVGVEEVIIQYAKNQSTTTPPTDGWSTSMPSYQEGYFLWIRTRIKYSNNSNYTYSTPICDESWKANQEVYSQYKQLKNQFSWIIKSGTSESNMVLTDALYKVLTETITLTAKNINLNGYINEGGNWSVDLEGNMETQDLSVKGEFSCDSLNLDVLNNPAYPRALDSSMNIYINATSGNDDADLEDGATFKTLSELLKRIPKNLNGKTINIELKSNITETVSVDWFNSGRLRLYFGGYTLYGTYTVYRSTCMHEVYGGTISDSTGKTGSIMPYDGNNANGISTSIFNVGSPDMMIYNIKVYASKTLASGCSESAGIICSGNGYMYTSDITIVGCTYGFRTILSGIIYDDSSSGKVDRFGFVAVAGGQIRLSNGKHTGGNTGNTYESSGGTVKLHSATFDGVSSGDSNTSTPPPANIVTTTYTSNYGDTYRSTWSSWKKDGTVRQSEAYGSGKCYGAWFFGSQFAELKGTTISKIVLKIKRNQAGSYNSATPHKLCYHKYSSRPSGQPTLTYFQTENIKYSGSYVSITITNSTVLNGIANGTIKGFGLYDSSFSSSNYTVCGGTAKATITYK